MIRAGHVIFPEEREASGREKGTDLKGSLSRDHTPWRRQLIWVSVISLGLYSAFEKSKGLWG